MADLGAIECAAGKWLQRLHGGERLPCQATIEVMRRRERSARQQAEALADAERRCADLAQQRLEDERHAAARQAATLEEVRAELEVERAKRVQAEAEKTDAREAQFRAERELEAERGRREAAERTHRDEQERVLELQKALEDDHSLEVLDEFRRKFERQRAEIETHQRRVEQLQEASAASSALLQRSRHEFDMAQLQWDRERQQLLRSRAELSDEVSRLSETGCALQAAAEETFQRCVDVISRVDTAAAVERSASLQPDILPGAAALSSTQQPPHDIPRATCATAATQTLLSDVLPVASEEHVPKLPMSAVASPFAVEVQLGRSGEVRIPSGCRCAGSRLSIDLGRPVQVVSSADELIRPHGQMTAALASAETAAEEVVEASLIDGAADGGHRGAAAGAAAGAAMGAAVGAAVGSAGCLVAEGAVAAANWMNTLTALQASSSAQAELLVALEPFMAGGQ